MSKTRRRASATLRIPDTQPSVDSFPIGGRSTSWIWISSKGIIPGRGVTVETGYSAITGIAFVRLARREDLPEFGKPTRAIWAAPSF